MEWSATVWSGQLACKTKRLDMPLPPKHGWIKQACFPEEAVHDSHSRTGTKCSAKSRLISMHAGGEWLHLFKGIGVEQKAMLSLQMRQSTMLFLLDQHAPVTYGRALQSL